MKKGSDCVHCCQNVLRISVKLNACTYDYAFSMCDMHCRRPCLSHTVLAAFVGAQAASGRQLCKQQLHARNGMQYWLHGRRSERMCMKKNEVQSK